MSKYEPLGAFLADQPSGVVRLTFEQIESILDAGLPPSARRYRSWWSNGLERNGELSVWAREGFRSEQVDMKSETVVFRRVSGGGPTPLTAEKVKNVRILSEHQSTLRHPAFGALKGQITIKVNVDLTLPADPEWAGTNG